MLNEEVKRYRELSGDNNPNTPISRIGGYLDGYEKAMEQRTGHWDFVKDDDGVPIMEFWKCSECGVMYEDKYEGLYKAHGFKEYNYCPKCGAKMQ